MYIHVLHYLPQVYNYKEMEQHHHQIASIIIHVDALVASNYCILSHNKDNKLVEHHTRQLYPYS